MMFLLIVLGLVVVLGIIAALVSRKQEIPKDEESSTTIAGGCCGMHMTCERDSLLSAVSPDIVYYDDEELDRFKGRFSGDYNDTEVDEFRDVLITLQEDDVAGWVRSLQKREINIPEELLPEVFMIVGENRDHYTKQSHR